MLTRDQLLTPAARPPVKVELLGDFAYVKAISFKALMPLLKLSDEFTRNSQVISLCVCDDKGAPVLSVADAMDFLTKQPADVSLGLLANINKMMPMSEQTVGQAEKNSETAPS